MLFITCINDLPLWINSVSEPILLANDTSVKISSKNFEDFCPVSNLVLNLDRMNTMKFITKNSSHSTLLIGYKEKYYEETANTKFLGLKIDNHINWKNRIEEMIHEVWGACYAVRFMVHISNINTLK